MRQLTGILGASAIGLAASTGLASAEVQYMDDRSTPQTLVQSYYNAINLKQYTRAYGYYSDGFAAKDYDSWAKGYADTKSVSVQFGATQPDPGAGQIYWALPVAISVLMTDGSSKVYGGCYNIHLTSPELQTDPPFMPISINSGSLKESDKPVQDAIPKSCDS